ncbi:hypothetical protein BN1708_004097 [Verticillium longisporum]|nr:Exosome complex component rrp45 like protein [Verticillium longisporum]CRK26043.1 hypothetical protein BN1708_004097 [Verticillium longisporum]
MPREAEPSVNEKEFILKALHEGVRLDGRPFDQYRNIDISFGDEYGVVDVSLGKTRVIVRISAEVTVPHADRPFDGIFQLATELSPMASPHFEPGKPTDTEMLLSRLLEKTIRRSGALDMESLCLVAGAKVWSVRADVHVVSHDGNIVDAACLAAVAALRHFRKPDAQVDGEDLTVFTPAERAPVPLGWLHSPFCVTFAQFDARDGGPDGDGRDGVTLLDPDWREEQLRVASCTISLNKHGEVCQVSKLGGDAVEATTLLQCAALAARKVGELSDLVDRTLAADAKRRDKGGLMAELSAENDRVAG